MPKQIIIAEQYRIAAVFSEDQIEELVVAKGTHQIGDIYLGIVENVLPGIDAAFVNIGDADRNGFIHVTDLGPLRLKRTAGAITELLAPQQKVLVQVMKEPTSSKGPRLTGKITLPGRYLVLMPFGRGVNLSRRIRNENERNRLRALAILIKPSGMGLLVRTEAEGVPEEAVIEDLETLQRQWEAIQQEASTTRAPALLNRDDDFVQRVLRDTYTAEVNRIVVDTAAGMRRVKQQISVWSSGKAAQSVLVDHHRERIPILDFFRVNAAIREALRPRVDLPSGGYIIIEPTEALTVIDVNSGSFTRSATARETVLWTNCEAAAEIARQIRLRNIAGVIIVDFIDMDSRRDQLQVLEQFNKALKADKARPQIAQLSELGLVELTRKRQGQNIYELFGRTCPTCGGLGHLAHLPDDTTDSGEPKLVALRDAAPPVSRSLEPRTRSRGISTGASRGLPTADAAPSTDDAVWEGTTRDVALRAEVEAEADLQALDLLHHPSYQERGTGNGNNRRRRRRRDEAAAGSRSPSRTDLAPEMPTVTTTGTLVERTARSALPDKPERGSRRRELPKPEPAAVVTVEMTPEEQEVYAFMGISPLTLQSAEGPPSRSTVVSVVLPGEKPAVKAGGSAVAASTSPSALDTPNDLGIEAPADVTPASPDFSGLTGEASAATPTPRVRRRRSSLAAVTAAPDTSPTSLPTSLSEAIAVPADPVSTPASPQDSQGDSQERDRLTATEAAVVESGSSDLEAGRRRRRRRSSAQDG
ncbi:Rne/Rng family ribonuclease [Trichothermofontia sp.]